MKKLIKSISLTLVVAIVAMSVVLGASGCSKKQGELRIADCGLLAPITFFESDNKLTGIGPDLGVLFAGEQNKKAKIDIFDFPGMLAAVASGTHDLLMNATPTPARAETLDFTVPYVTMSAMFITRSNDTRLDACTTKEEINDVLNGKRVGTLPGSTHDNYIKAANGATSVNYNDIGLLLTALAQSHVDFVLYEFLVTDAIQTDILEKNSGIKIIEVTVDSADIAMAVRKGNTTLLSKLNDFIADIKQGGKLDEIIARYV